MPLPGFKAFPIVVCIIIVSSIGMEYTNGGRVVNMAQKGGFPFRLTSTCEILVTHYVCEDTLS